MKLPFGIKGYTRVVAFQECSAGNEVTGSAWVETKTFSKETPVTDIIDWAKSKSGTLGRLTITIDESSFIIEEKQ